jgi:hypothetical protein
MQPCTKFRLAAHDNGYWMLLNDCKLPTPMGKGWQKLSRPDRAEILSWDRSIFTSTGMKIDGDLAVIDIDSREKALVDALADALDERYPELFVHGLVRHAGEVKQAWFVRTKKPFQPIRSRKWTRGDATDPKAEKQQVECFSSATTRQFGIHGPHSRDPKTGKILRTYQFVDDASPATMPRATLPILPKAAFVDACNLFEGIAESAGLKLIKRQSAEGGEGKRAVYDLADDMVFEGESDTYNGLEELGDALAAAKHEGHDLRVSSSFLGHGTNLTKCIVSHTRSRPRCICIHDFETGLTHLPADRKPAKDRLREGFREWQAMLATLQTRR